MSVNARADAKRVMRSSPRTLASALMALAAACGWLATTGGLMAWHGWAVKWYLLVAATGSAVAATAGWLVQPHRWRSVVTWCVLAMVYGAVVLSVVGYVLVYKISGATD